MQTICTLAQALFVVLILTLFIVGLITVISALGSLNSTPKQVAKRTNAEIEQIASEGCRTMNDLSEQYLHEIYDKVTHSIMSTTKNQ